jgi:hypothetical protein
MVLRWSAAGVLEAERGFRKMPAIAQCRFSSPRCALAMRRPNENQLLTMGRKLRK